MATKNFSVKNGLTVGNVIIDAGTNSISGIDSITALQALLTDITTTGNANLGNVANVHIGGGLAKQLLQTDGNGGLSWYSYTPDSGLTAAVDVFTGSGDTATYTLSLNPASENFTTVVIDGVTQLKTTYSVSGTTLTIGANLPPFARMEVTTLVGYGNSALTATVDTYLGNGNANTYQLSVTPPSVGATSVIIDGVSQLKNAYVLDGQQIILGEALPADSVLEITTLIGADLSPNYANYAGEANIANTAYSVSVANVSGIGNIATVNLDGNASNVLTGSGTWVNITASDNANYANYSGEAAIANLATYATTANSVAGANVTGTVANATTATTAGTVTTAAQPNITLTGTLTSLNVSGNITVNSKQAVNGPAFAVYADSTTQTIVSSTQTKVLFQVEEFDTNSNFVNSRFTPTVEGYYQLNSEIRIGGPSDTGESMMGIWKNGSEYRRGYNSSGTEQGANFYSMGVSTLVYANGSTDYFEVYAQQSSGSSKDITTVNASYLTWFNGAMLRGA